MFKCDACGQQAHRGEPQTVVAITTREKVYPVRGQANRLCVRTNTYPDDPGGKGYETVKEVRGCPRCAAAVAPAEGGVTPEVHGHISSR
jgi:hypothetical protein